MKLSHVNSCNPHNAIAPVFTTQDTLKVDIRDHLVQHPRLKTNIRDYLVQHPRLKTNIRDYLVQHPRLKLI